MYFQIHMSMFKFLRDQATLEMCQWNYTTEIPHHRI